MKGNENTVTLSDIEEIKKIIDDPELMRGQFNQNTISLIRNLSILPYYSVKSN
ncbi:MAG: hypothetical protein KGH61_04610 [Candidatus Micrarchaeota archaeon]|nr:hypothetical protein [Candidatus Micrarchaeota archaeon]MDE1848199.1 hypothetical protein [Candidatus Micrarchaeota archaeon]MDE1864847.1 hypothetical protein [Candidatus Micrarchaeota archaeon]